MCANTERRRPDQAHQVWPAPAWRLTRRSFLALCLAGCSRLARRPWPVGEEPSGQTWALIADTHISRVRKRSVRGSCMADNLERVVADVLSAEPDHVLFGGDLAYSVGEQADYAAFRELITPLADRGMPLHFMPGNHDRRARLVEALPVATDVALPAKAVSVLSAGGAQWFFLDSVEDGSIIRGSLGPPQREWLARKLDGAAGPAIICLHHNPERTMVGLKDAQELLDIVLPRRRVKVVLFGHLHTFRVWQHEGLHFVNLPAAGFRSLEPGSSLGWVQATLTENGMRLHVRGITPHEPHDGEIHDLPWRNDA